MRPDICSLYCPVAPPHRSGQWMQTHTGRRFYPLDPRREDICIEDIAHALSNICRFGGHVRDFYSVAQHSVIVASLLPPHLQLAGLLHDASEAYLVDIPKPLKVVLPDYQRIERRLESIIAEVFSVSFSDPAIKRADSVALVSEARDLLGVVPVEWDCFEDGIALVDPIFPIAPHHARRAFLYAFKKYTQ